jgi:hypothetical protein
MSPFLKFCQIIPFLILLLTNYKEWGGNESTHFILQTKQKSDEWEDDGLAYFLHQTPYNIFGTWLYGIAPKLKNQILHLHNDLILVHDFMAFLKYLGPYLVQ